MPTTGSNDIYIANFINNPQVEFLIDRLVEEYPDDYDDGMLAEPLKKACNLKFRDIIAETVSEFTRKGNFVRIYPARNSKMYDKFFSGQKHLSKIIYKTLFSNEIIPYSRGGDKTVKQNLGKQHGILNSAGSTLQHHNNNQMDDRESMGGSKMGSRGSNTRIHSSTGVRPIRGSKSNNKLFGNSNTIAASKEREEERKEQMMNSSQPLKNIRHVS